MQLQPPDSRSLVAQSTHRGWYPTTERTWFMEESRNEDVFWAPGVSKTVTAVLREADRRAPKLTPRPLQSRCGPPSPSVFLPSAAAAIWQRPGAVHAAGRPATAVARADAHRQMPPVPRPAPPAQRAAYHSFHICTDRHRKGAAVAFEAQARSCRTWSRSRCLARRAPAPACRAAPNTFRIWGFQEGGEKNGGGKAPDWPHSRLFE